MSKCYYYFYEFSKDDSLRSVAETAKNSLLQNENVVHIYQKCTNSLYGKSPSQILSLIRSNNHSVFSSSPSSSKQDRNSSYIEKSNRSPSTPVKRNPDVSTVPHRYLPLDITDAEASRHVTTSREKLSTPDNSIPNMYHESESREYLQIDNTDNESLKHTTTSRKTLFTPEKINLEATEHENSTQNHMQVGIKKSNEILRNVIASLIKNAPKNITQNIKDHGSVSELPDYTNKGGSELNKKIRKQLTPTKINSNIADYEDFQQMNIPFYHKKFDKDQRKTIAVSPKKTVISNLNSKVENIATSCKNYVGFASKKAETVGKPNTDKQKLATSYSDEVIAIFTKYTKNSNFGEESQIAVISNINDEQKTRPVEKSKTLDSKIFISPLENALKIPYEDEKNIFNASSFKRAKESVSPKSNTPLFTSPGKMFKSIGIVDKDREVNVSPNQGNEDGKEKRKFPSPRRQSGLFRSMPRFMQASGLVEIDSSISFTPRGKPSPTASPISSTYHLSGKTVTNATHKERLPKDINCCVESDSSSYFSSSPTKAATGSSHVGKSSPIGKDLGNQHFYETSKGSPPARHFYGTLSSPETNPPDLSTLLLGVRKLNNLKSLRDRHLQQIFGSLVIFQSDIDFLHIFTKGLAQLVTKIFTINKHNVNQELKENTVSLLTVISKLIRNLGMLKMDVDVEVLIWNKRLEQISQIKSENEPLTSDGKLLVSFEYIQAYEGDLRNLWKKLDDIGISAESKRLSFLNTANDMERVLNLFVKCIITVGILRPLSTLHHN